jgi:phosphoribosylformimino-5-aminoimidazole carboxamide ribotide isomerase
MSLRPFLIYPAIDLRAGKVVRLRQGAAADQTTYSDDPAACARRWEEAGARFLHVVDLDGAFDGTPRNWASVREILKVVQIPVQLGGGLRSRSQIEDALALGVTRCVVGTKACETPAFVEELAGAFGVHVAVGIDARDGYVAVRGWTEKTALPATEFGKEVSRRGVAHIIFTDVATDGMLAGPNYAAIAGMCQAAECFVIASGGVGEAGHIAELRRMTEQYRNLTGVIVGKALYDGRVNLAAVVD